MIKDCIHFIPNRLAESWFLVPIICDMVIHRNTNKVYVPYKIVKSNMLRVVAVNEQYRILRKIPIKQVRTKSIVLQKKLHKGDHIQVIYEHWERNEELDFTLKVIHI